MSIIAKITQLLDSKKISQKDLTDYLGIDKSTFSQWKNGKSQSYNKYLSKIAEFLNVSTDYLLNNSEKNDEKDDGNTDRVKILFRHLQDIPENDREQLIDTLESTVDIYLKAKGLK